MTNLWPRSMESLRMPETLLLSCVAKDFVCVITMRVWFAF